MTAGPRFDWSAMVFCLEAAGLSQREIAKRCGVQRHSWVNDLKNIEGTQPKFHDGAMLLALWQEVTGQAPTFAPRAGGAHLVGIPTADRRDAARADYSAHPRRRRSDDQSSSNDPGARRRAGEKHR